MLFVSDRQAEPKSLLHKGLLIHFFRRHYFVMIGSSACSVISTNAGYNNEHLLFNSITFITRSAPKSCILRKSWDNHLFRLSCREISIGFADATTFTTQLIVALRWFLLQLISYVCFSHLPNPSQRLSYFNLYSFARLASLHLLLSTDVENNNGVSPKASQAQAFETSYFSIQHRIMIFPISECFNVFACDNFFTFITWSNFDF